MSGLSPLTDTHTHAKPGQSALTRVWKCRLLPQWWCPLQFHLGGVQHIQVIWGGQTGWLHLDSQDAAVADECLSSYNKHLAGQCNHLPHKFTGQYNHLPHTRAVQPPTSQLGSATTSQDSMLGSVVICQGWADWRWNHRLNWWGEGHDWDSPCLQFCWGHGCQVWDLAKCRPDPVSDCQPASCWSPWQVPLLSRPRTACPGHAVLIWTFDECGDSCESHAVGPILHLLPCWPTNLELGHFDWSGWPWMALRKAQWCFALVSDSCCPGFHPSKFFLRELFSYVLTNLCMSPSPGSVGRGKQGNMVIAVLYLGGQWQKFQCEGLVSFWNQPAQFPDCPDTMHLLYPHDTGQHCIVGSNHSNQDGWWGGVRSRQHARYLSTLANHKWLGGHLRMMPDNAVVIRSHSRYSCWQSCGLGC